MPKLPASSDRHLSAVTSANELGLRRTHSESATPRDDEPKDQPLRSQCICERTGISGGLQDSCKGGVHMIHPGADNDHAQSGRGSTRLQSGGKMNKSETSKRVRLGDQMTKTMTSFRAASLQKVDVLVVAWQQMRQMPYWPQPESVINPAIMANAMRNPNVQEFERNAHKYLISDQCARELAVLCRQPARFWLGFTISTFINVALTLFVHTWHWHALGASALEVVPCVMIAILFTLHWAIVARMGPATAAWSVAVVAIVVGVVLTASYVDIYTLFVPAEQIFFGSRFARLAITTIFVSNGVIWTAVAIPRTDGVQTEFMIAMGWHVFVRAIRIADCTSDLELSDMGFKKINEGECIWLGGSSRCDLYLVLAVGNLIAGLMDFVLAVSIILFAKFINSDSKFHRMLEASIHIISLVLEIIMLAINLFFAFAIAQLDADNTGTFGSTSSMLCFYAASLCLTLLSCYLNIVGAREILVRVKRTLTVAASPISRTWKHARQRAMSLPGLRRNTVLAVNTRIAPAPGGADISDDDEEGAVEVSSFGVDVPTCDDASLPAPTLRLAHQPDTKLVLPSHSGAAESCEDIESR